MDPTRVVSGVSQALGESDETVDAVLRSLFQAYAEAVPTDWSGVEQILSAQAVLEYEKVAALLDALRALASEAGGADDPRSVFDDQELRGYFGTDTGTATADQSAAPAPVADGSLIHRVGDAYYLGEAHQVWPATSGDTVYYHDGTQNYDTLGRPLDAPDAASPAAGQPEDHEAWNSYLAQNGPRWDGTEAAWRQFRDWFLYDAAAHQVGGSAQGFIALAESGDKRAVFADYGVTLPAATSSGVGGGEDLLHRLRDEVMEPALARILADPELAELGETRLRELLAEVTADHLESRAG